MTKRQLRADKLYKLTRVVVIIVTVISALLAAYEISLDSHSSFQNSKLSANSECVYITDNEIYKKCVKSIEDIYQSAIDLEYHSILIAIFLPLFFFGGTKLYKYLFPIKK